MSTLAIFLATGEIALRIIYHDAGTRTSGGPGGRRFQHLTTRNGHRGRLDLGPKLADTPRIMIVGDSITWGAGVRNWHDTWPEQLARLLEDVEWPFQMAVLAAPGRDIHAHVDEIQQSLTTVDPDVFIYQWYVNDIEPDAGRRPNLTRAWQRWPGHEWLRKRSYLYYFFDNRLATLLPPPGRSYVDYLLHDYAPGSLLWAEFERSFNTLAMRAKEAAPTRLLVIYPQVPFRGTSPLQPIYDRMHTIAGAHRLVIPAVALLRYGGELVVDSDPPAVRFTVSPRGPAFDTRDYYLAPGDQEVVVTVSIGATVATFGELDLLDAGDNHLLARAPLSAEPGGWREVAVHLTVPATARHVRLRLAGNGLAPFAVSQLALPVDYGFQVVDLTGSLNSFNTHASIFDAHPNERAHKVVAEGVFEALTHLPAEH